MLLIQLVNFFYNNNVNMKSRKRSKSKSRSRSPAFPSCKISSQLNGLIKINSIKWDIRQHPDYNNSIFNVADVIWCSGNVKLLLPITRSIDSTTAIVYYEEIICRKYLRVKDILSTIYNFYHKLPVISTDLSYISISKAGATDVVVQNALQKYQENVKSLHNYHFIHFMGNQTKFTGLKHQHDNVYTVTLENV